MQKIFVTLAFLIVLGHNAFPHHHFHHEGTAAQHLHGNDDDDDADGNAAHDNPFCFKQLDHVFTSSGAEIALTPAAIVYLLPEHIYIVAPVVTTARIEYVFKDEFPPPGPPRHTASFRGPPVS
ncbi:MAG: hypothetical protein JST39_00495 [Bacteroidetes bacterium]|nr:hypothetical protein [Bacteroidota bacterium]